MHIKVSSAFTALLTFAIFFLSSCSSNIEDLTGLWMSEDGENKITIRNDTLFHSSYWWQKVNKKGRILGLSKLDDASKDVGEIWYKNNRLHYQFFEDNTVELFTKSKSNNLLEASAERIGLDIELPDAQGFENTVRKGRLIRIYMAEPDTLTIADSTIAASSLDSFLLRFQSRTSVTLIIDRELQFPHFLKLHNSLFNNHFLHPVYHGIRPKQTLQWQNSIYLTSLWIPNLKSHPLYSIPQNAASFDLEFTETNKLHFKGCYYELNEIYPLVTYEYAKSRKASYFQIRANDNLSYGNYVLLVSIIKDVVTKARDSYCFSTYNKTWQEVRYDLSPPGSILDKDSLVAHVRDLFPYRVLIDDM